MSLRLSICSGEALKSRREAGWVDGCLCRRRTRLGQTEFLTRDGDCCGLLIQFATTALICAAHKGQVAAIECLVKRGAEVEARDDVSSLFFNYHLRCGRLDVNANATVFCSMVGTPFWLPCEKTVRRWLSV